MRILLTNDDGFDAPGIVALWQALHPLPGVELEVMAPAECHSCMGHVFTDSFRVRSANLDSIGPIRIVDGTPADCVCAAMNLPGRPRPDWVIAGINRGSNLGVDLYNSGTAAAARQAAIFGIPAIAISQLARKDQIDDWPRTTREAAAILSAILAAGPAPLTGGGGPASPAVLAEETNAFPPPNVRERNLYQLTHAALASMPLRSGPAFYNVNIPKLPADRAIAEVRLVPPSCDPTDQRYERVSDPEGNLILTYSGVYLNRPVSPGTDVAAVFADAVAISCVSV